MESYYMFDKKKPTRIILNTQTLLDVTLKNKLERSKEAFFYITGISDHANNIIVINLQFETALQFYMTM